MVRFPGFRKFVPLALLVGVLLGGWFFSPGYALFGDAAAPEQAAAASDATQTQSEEMSQLCQRHMQEMRPAMDEMMHDMMSDMMHGGMR